MKRIGMGLVGPGFVGRHHIDAVRRLGFVDVVAVAASSESSARRKADELGVARAYGGFEALAADPDVHVVHNTTPNYLHEAVILATLAHKKHVVSDKPLATDVATARRLCDVATRAGVVHAVTFNYRGNPMVQQARTMIAAGDIGEVRYVQGAYLQDWLIHPTDYSWRLDPEQGGESSAMGDIGSHWCDLVQHVTGQRIVEVLAELSTVVPSRIKPLGSREAFEQQKDARGETVKVTSEDLATVLLRFDGGAKGCVSVGQVCAGHRNDLWFEANGRTGSLRWRQEQQNELWIGRRGIANSVMAKDPELLAPAAARYAHLPGGHQEAWSDAFANVIRDIYAAVALVADGRRPPDVKPPAFATFADGYHSACVVEAVLDSHRHGGVWTKVPTLIGATR
ncbi:MAG TPA: Gfo/Idh/MocA family oxidoreductase [Vicinamibacterales bacterium]